MEVGDGARVLVLGAYGNTGRELTRGLLEHTSAEVILAGRKADRLARLKELLDDIYPGRVTMRLVDVSARTQLARTLRDATLVVVASSTTRHLPAIARTCFTIGADYLDFWYSPRLHQEMAMLHDEARSRGRTAIVQCGIHPGMITPLIRAAHAMTPLAVEASAAAYITSDWAHLQFSPSTISEIEEPFATLFLRDGEWRSVGRVAWQFDFGLNLGRHAVQPVYYAEMRALPELCPGLRSARFGILSTYGQPSPPPYHACVVAQATTPSGAGTEVRVSCPNGFALTALSAIACVRRRLQGEAEGAGVVIAGTTFVPDTYLKELVMLSVEVTKSTIAATEAREEPSLRTAENSVPYAIRDGRARTNGPPYDCPASVHISGSLGATVPSTQAELRGKYGTYITTQQLSGLLPAAVLTALTVAPDIPWWGRVTTALVAWNLWRRAQQMLRATLCFWRDPTLNIAICNMLLDRVAWTGCGRMLDIGTGGGLIAIGAAKRWPQARVVGIDTWRAGFLSFSLDLCNGNANLNDVEERTQFQTGNAAELPFPNSTFDAVVANSVFHMICVPDKEPNQLVIDSLRVLRKGGAFAFNDLFEFPTVFGRLDELIAELTDLGCTNVTYAPMSELIDIPIEIEHLTVGHGVLSGNKG